MPTPIVTMTTAQIQSDGFGYLLAFGIPALVAGLFGTRIGRSILGMVGLRLR